MKKLAILTLVIFAVVAIGCKGGGLPTGVSIAPANTTTGATSTSTGYPTDFPALSDTGGSGSGTALTGFGGDLTKDQAANRAAVAKVPVILIHGNGGNANHTQWGMTTLKSFLKAAGYNDSEIWAVSYLGATNASADMSDPHRNNIDDVRTFIDTVINYLGVSRVVLIGHSLGAGMIRSYMLGLVKSGSFDTSKTRFTKIAALITLAGANYGLGTYSTSEFKTGCTFEINTHKVTGTSTWDDTPYGATSSEFIASITTALPNSRTYNGGKFNATTSLDGDASNRIYYAGITATGDFVDAQLANTGYLQGADLNKGYSLGSSLTGHEKVIKDQNVFNTGIKPILDKANAKYPITPVPVTNPPVTSISPSSSTFTTSVSVTISATNNPTSVQYNLNGGAWQTYSGAITITATTTVNAKASNQYGESQVVTATFTKTETPPPPAYETAYDTATNHYLAKRLDINGYIAMGTKYGYINKFNLYKAAGSSTWTDVIPQ